MTEDERRQAAIAAIPKDWISKEDGLRHIMAVENCSREEALALFAEFEAMFPDSVKTVQ